MSKPFLRSISGKRGPDTDHDLVRAYRSTGDLRHVAKLLERYSGLVAALAFKHFRNPADADDFSGELFLTLSDRLKRVDPDEIRNFKPWLYTVTRNAILDQLRKKQTYQQHRDQFGAYQPEAGGVEEQNHLGMDKHHLQTALESLPEHERLCIEAIYLEGLSYKEVMERHRWTFNKLRGTRERALKKLRNLLKQEFTTYFKYP